MDSERIKKSNFRKIALVVVVISLVFGATLTTIGFLSVRDAKSKVDAISDEEISERMTTLSIERSTYQKQLAEENEKENKISSKIDEIRKKIEELSNKISDLTRLRYSRETGYNNPRNVDEMLSFAPTIWIGVVVIIIGIVVASVLIAISRR